MAEARSVAWRDMAFKRKVRATQSIILSNGKLLATAGIM